MASVIPAFVIAAALRVLDTHGVLIVVYLLFNVPFTVLMMRGFFEEISKDIEEAAMIDGCFHAEDAHQDCDTSGHAGHCCHPRFSASSTPGMNFFMRCC